MIKVENVRKVFRDRKHEVEAVSGVSFEAHAGKVFGLLGPNGAGKTTLLRMISTSIQPTSGTISVNEFDVISQAVEARQSLGFLSNNTLLYGRLNPKEILNYFGRLYGMENKVLKSRIDELAEQFQFQDFLTRSIDKLSTGMKQKVNIARTVLHDPQVVIFDEPTAGLDVLASRSIIDFVQQSKDAGKTVVFSTHIMREVERLCDHVAVIHEGNFVFTGSIEELQAKKVEGEEIEDLFLRLLEMGTET